MKFMDKVRWLSTHPEQDAEEVIDHQEQWEDDNNREMPVHGPLCRYLTHPESNCIYCPLFLGRNKCKKMDIYNVTPEIVQESRRKIEESLKITDCVRIWVKIRKMMSFVNLLGKIGLFLRILFLIVGWLTLLVPCRAFYGFVSGDTISCRLNRCSFLDEHNDQEDSLFSFIGMFVPGIIFSVFGVIYMVIVIVSFPVFYYKVCKK